MVRLGALYIKEAVRDEPSFSRRDMAAIAIVGSNIMADDVAQGRCRDEDY